MKRLSFISVLILSLLLAAALLISGCDDEGNCSYSGDHDSADDDDDDDDDAADDDDDDDDNDNDDDDDHDEQAPCKFPVNSTTESSQTQPSIAMAPDGSFAVVWMEYEDSGDGYLPTDSEVRGRFFEADTTAKDDDFSLSGSTDNNQLYPVASMGADGTLVAAWTADDHGTDYENVFVRRFTSDGDAFESEFQADDSLRDYQGIDAIAIREDGGFIVTWWATENYQSNNDVFARLFDSDADPIDDGFMVNPTAAGYQGSSSVAVAADGSFAVTWDSESGKDSSKSAPYDVYCRRYDSNGSSLGDAFMVNTETEDCQCVSDIAMADDGSFVVTYHSDGEDGDGFGIFARRYDADGDPIGAEFQVNQTTAGAQKIPAIAMNGNGNFAIVWNSEESSVYDWQVFARMFNSDGTPITDEFMVVHPHTRDQGGAYPDVAMDSFGNIVVVWQTWGIDGDQWGIYGQRYDAEGEPICP